MWRRTAPAERDATAPRVRPSSRRAALRGLIAAALLIAPLGAWLVRYAGWVRVGDALAVVTLVAAVWLLTRALGRVATLVGVALAAALLAAAFVRGVPSVYAPPVAINLAVAAIFGLSWWRGDPLVTRFARLQPEPVTAKVERYTRRLTLIWALYLGALGAVGILIAWHGDERWGAWWSGLLDYLFIAALFVGELVYRHRSTRGLLEQLRSVRAVLRRRSA